MTTTRSVSMSDGERPVTGAVTWPADRWVECVTVLDELLTDAPFPVRAAFVALQGVTGVELQQRFAFFAEQVYQQLSSLSRNAGIPDGRLTTVHAFNLMVTNGSLQAALLLLQADVQVWGVPLKSWSAEFQTWVMLVADGHDPDAASAVAAALSPVV
jgi:hypothetical protein